MDNESIIAKIKKCLALAKSDNPHEAANALRQAQKMMEIHNISSLDVQASNIQETQAKASTVETVRWEVSLARLVSKAFACAFFVSSGHIYKDLAMRRTLHYHFVGVTPAADIAQYAFEVLSEQCKKARRRYIGAQRKNCKASTKIARGDMFAEGFVNGVRNLIQDFASPTENKELISLYLQEKHPDIKQGQAKDRVSGKNTTYKDYASGREEAKNAKLHHGVGTDGSTPFLLG